MIGNTTRRTIATVEPRLATPRRAKPAGPAAAQPTPAADPALNGPTDRASKNGGQRPWAVNADLMCLATPSPRIAVRNLGTHAHHDEAADR